MDNKRMKQFETASRVISTEEFIKRLQEVEINSLVVEEPKIDKFVIEKLDRVIDLLELTTEQNNQILTNTSTSRKELRREDIICFEVSKALYKKSVDTGKYIKVAFITGESKINFLVRNENVIDNPSYYESTWYYLNEVGELRYSTFDIVKVNQIYVESSVENDKYYVTGYIDDKGKAIYYDQFI